MRKAIKFIHCADLHLDSPFKGLKDLPEEWLTEIRKSTFKALDRLVEQAIDLEVDFVIMVGDLFDQEQQSMQAHMALRDAFQRLQKYDIPVFVSFGNHDFLSSQTFPRNYPDNVHVFDSENVSEIPFFKRGKLMANVYGFSYYHRAVLTNKVKEYQLTNDDCFHIATLHGSLGNEKTNEHAVYAPFQLSDLKQSGFDYWALGHIHKREVLAENPMVVYPGNIQGRSTKETGSKGCYVVTMTNNQTDLEFLPLAPIELRKLKINASDWNDMTKTTEEIAAQLQHQQRQEKILTQLTFEQVPEHCEHWFKQGFIDEMIDYLNQSSHMNYVINYKWSKAAKRSQWIQGGRFLDELNHALQDTEIEQINQMLWQHTDGRKWLGKLDEADKQDIEKEAAFLLDQLLHEKEV
ncbi:DNA repair exonuclease [Gracilibacillus caseinilyticus]|uniref:DNA repair exonuclease n=1 Tax=Gracilibacillus caseinilyticus TaxID=2932256 RepID=A0ABY4ESD3_9BACI|nr:DNA repair exonuclease [Gracilibacillus caseinilyticus]UOQ46797.1 DNA repair exonuclease [Gracilibacillus caseinilyticus]